MPPTTMLRPAVRQFRQQPLYTLACAGTLALAVAAATTSFAVVGPAFLEPLPFAAGDALVTIYTNTETWATAPVSARVMTELEESGAPVSEVTALDPDGVAYATATSMSIAGSFTRPLATAVGSTLALARAPIGQRRYRYPGG